jgi:hypothetical protein
VVVAAIVLLVVIGVLTLVTNSSDHDTPGGDGNRSAATSSTTTGPSSRARRLQLSDLGEFASPTALRAALRLATTAPSPSPRRAAPELTEAQVDRCGTVIEARDPGLTRANRRRTLVATIDGEAVVVLEYQATSVRTGRPTTRIVAVGVAACDDQLDFER